MSVVRVVNPLCAVCCLAVAFFFVGCAGDTTSSETSGSLSLSLELADGVDIDQVEWTISGGNMEDMSGTIDTSAPEATASVEVFGLPASIGPDYTITLEAVAEDGTTCEGSRDFGVDAGEVTTIMVFLNCKRPTTLGGVRANGEFNICAELAKVIVSPLQTSVNNDIDLFVETMDVEDNPVEIEWSATSGSIAEPNAEETTFACGEEDASITVTVSDDGFVHCTHSWTVDVACVGGGGTGGTGGGGAGGEGGMAGAGGAGGEGGTGGTVEIPLPMVVDEFYSGRSGFGPNGPPLHIEDDQCPERAGDEQGACHRFTWDGGGTFTGTFWTDGNGFVDLNGLPVEGGANEVRFYAWGAAGGEVIEFGAGIAGEEFDGANDNRIITLTTTPTLYSVPLVSLADYDDVFGPFVWAANDGNNPSGLEFYVDDIQWVSSPVIPLPMVVDDNYSGRSGFGPNGPPLHEEDDQCPERAGEQLGECHRFTWDGSGMEGAFSGTVWTDGEGFMDLNGPLVEPGANEVRFYAWGATGGEKIEFGAGLMDSQWDGATDRIRLTLTTTPTEYTVPLENLADYRNVFGAFLWSANNVPDEGNPSGFEFYVDDIQWVNTRPPVELRPLPDIYRTGNAINYSAFRAGGPGEGEIPEEADILEDLELLNTAGYDLIRLFGVDEISGAEKILRLAAENFPEMRFQQGLFIDAVAQDAPEACESEFNDEQVESVIRLASTYDNVVAVSVGNETSFFGPGIVPVDCLEGYITRTRDGVTQPVTADDDFTFYSGVGRSGESPDGVLRLIDFVAIHMYPITNYRDWDWRQLGVPAGPERAEAMMNEASAVAQSNYQSVYDYRYRNVSGVIGSIGESLPIVVGETGWKWRQTAPAQEIETYAGNPVNAKWYQDLMRDWERSPGGPPTLFLFTSFDEVWKGEDDGWGVWDEFRMPLYALCATPAGSPCNDPIYEGAGFFSQ